ncbi:unnamed protein product [Cuscuta campestris]|uniref:PH domain-containing protein n=1 Tax=Cuscuta campestris TaxID=132261 RepID=A0A484KQ59_9ASTE|nr:unnamed protein product [Cuscuta campestris]
MEFLSRSWSISSHEISKSIAPTQPFVKNFFGGPSNAALYLAGDAGPISEGNAGELVEAASVSGNPFSFASSDTSQLIMERIMSQAQDASPRTSGRLSHSSGGPLTDSTPASPSDMDDGHKLYCRLNNLQMNYNHHQYRSNNATPKVAVNGGGCKTVGRWFKDRKEKKKEETRAHNAQLHAAVSVAGVAAAVAAVAAAAAASTSASCKDEHTAKTNMAVASAATLVAAQCVEAAESMGAEREHLAAVVSSAVNVRSAGDIMTLTAAAATALRGAATLRARAYKEDVWNVAAVIPVEKGFGGNGSSSSSSGELISSTGHHLLPLRDDNFLGICGRELVSKGGELLKRTRKGELHWKIVSVYINRMGQVTLKTKSRHVAGTITKKKKNVVVEVLRDLPAWPGRHLMDGGENLRYFGLRTASRRVVEFECRDQRECDVWTQGVSRLLSYAAERRKGGILGHARYH